MRSLCTLALATLLVAVDARPDSLFLAIIGGAMRRTLQTARRSSILNPLSASHSQQVGVIPGNHLLAQFLCHLYNQCTNLTKSSQ